MKKILILILLVAVYGVMAQVCSGVASGKSNLLPG